MMPPGAFRWPGALAKPWYVHQPAQVFRRLAAMLRPQAAGYRALRTSLGFSIVADPARDIGRSIAHTGVYEPAVAELLARLVRPGDTVVDAGANVGFMTVIAAIAAAPGGRVLAFEPHPELSACLRRNVTHATDTRRIAAVEVYPAALGPSVRAAVLVQKAGYATNDGVSSIGMPAGRGDVGIPVEMTTLDVVLGTEGAAVLKLDVEQYEFEVLEGARRAIAEHRISHVVFEEYGGPAGATARALRSAGYELFALGWSLGGILLRPADEVPAEDAREAPTFVATVRGRELRERCRARGWRLFDGSFRARTASLTRL